jgi:glycyl-tRNA synthetase alpha chain
MNFQDMISRLNLYWAKQGCALLQPRGLEKGEGSFSPAFLSGALLAGPAALACVESCRGTGRHAPDPLRLCDLYQYQVLLKPPPADIRGAFLGAFRAAGIDLAEHDLRWLAADYDSPAMRAAGAGWELLLDGWAAARFTYLRRAGGREPASPAALLVFGLERLALCAQKKRSVGELRWNENLSYAELHGGAAR